MGCAADVNAQYVAGASSVELGEGDPEHWEPGETLPNGVLKRPGWVRLKRAVKGARMVSTCLPRCGFRRRSRST